VQAQSSWSKRAPLIEPNSETAVTQLGDTLYVIGGYPSSRQTVDTVQVYNAKTDTWKIVAPLPTVINHAMAASVNGKVYLLGGQTKAGGRGFRAAFDKRTFEYDPATDKRTEKAPMPRQRGGGAAAVVGHKIYVAGGRPPAGAWFSVYDTKSDTWEVLPDMPTQRNHLIAGAIDGKVYVAAGRFGPGFRSEQTAALEVYEPATRKWSARKPLPRPRGGVNGIVANGCFHVLGGEGNDDHPEGVYADHDVYNPKTDTWTKLEPLPIPVHGVTGSAFIDGLIYFPGGGIRIGGSSGDVHNQVYRTQTVC